jgi:hypothetical protein
MQRQSLDQAINKLAIEGEQGGFSIEPMIQLLNSGLSVEALLELIAWRLEAARQPLMTDRFILSLDRTDAPVA